MSKFIQLHYLTSYPPSNLNRDDLGRPKTARMGGCERLRVSSQSLKRNWRTSDLFQQSLSGSIGTRTKRIGVQVAEKLLDGGIAEKKANDWATDITKQFGAIKKGSLEIEQLVHVSPYERQQIDQLVALLIEEKRAPEKGELELLRSENMAVDIALFGRMLASSPEFDIEAACQVAHAISVHAVTVEDDYFTAVDDLNTAADQGAAHIGESGFAAALYYGYVCIDRELLIDNLGGNQELANQAIKTLIEAVVKVSPKGKQNSFASRAYASFAMLEKGEQQPRSLSAAFLKPVAGLEQSDEAVERLIQQQQNFDQVYGDCADARVQFNAFSGEGSLQALLDFISD